MSSSYHTIYHTLRLSGRHPWLRARGGYSCHGGKRCTVRTSCPFHTVPPRRQARTKPIPQIARNSTQAIGIASVSPRAGSHRPLRRHKMAKPAKICRMPITNSARSNAVPAQETMPGAEPQKPHTGQTTSRAILPRPRPRVVQMPLTKLRDQPWKASASVSYMVVTKLSRASISSGIQPCNFTRYPRNTHEDSQ
jgi:hypothetical protein